MFPHVTFGQSIVSGAAAGTVQDTSGLPLSGVHVILSEVGTGFTRELETGADGRFDFLFLSPGEYVVFAKIGEGCLLWQQVTIMHQAKIGDFAVVSCNSSVGDSSVIGENVFIAGGCQVNGRVVVEDDAYIGSGAILSPGCTIGRRSVIGLNSTVTRDVPPETICAGPMAKIVKRGTDKIMAHIDNSNSGEKIVIGVRERE